MDERIKALRREFDGICKSMKDAKDLTAKSALLERTRLVILEMEKLLADWQKRLERRIGTHQIH